MTHSYPQLRFSDLLRCYKAPLNCLGQDALPIDAPPIIRDSDENTATAMLRAEADNSFGLLTSSDTFIGRFKAVIDGVANKVRQRLTNAFNDRLIQFRALALDIQSHPLAGCRFKLSHDTWHTAEDRPDRLGADRHGAILQFAGQVVQIGHFGDLRYTLNGKLLCQHRLSDHQFADRVHQTVQLFQIDANGLACLRGSLRSGCSRCGGFFRFLFRHRLDRHGLCLWLRLLFSDRHWRFQNEFGSGRSRDFFKHWFGIDLFNAEFAFRADEIKDVGNVAAWHADWKPILPFQISRSRIEGTQIGNLVT